VVAELAERLLDEGLIGEIPEPGHFGCYGTRRWRIALRS
jgi:hypothetical protein